MAVEGAISLASARRRGRRVAFTGLAAAAPGLLSRAGGALGLGGGMGMGLVSGIAAPLAVAGAGTLAMMDAAAWRNVSGQAAGMTAGHLFAAQHGPATAALRMASAQVELAGMPAALAKAEAKGGTLSGEEVQHFIALAGEIKALTQAMKDSAAAARGAGSGTVNPSDPHLSGPIHGNVSPR